MLPFGDKLAVRVERPAAVLFECQEDRGELILFEGHLCKQSSRKVVGLEEYGYWLKAAGSFWEWLAPFWRPI